MIADKGWLGAVQWPRPAAQWQDKSMLGFAGSATAGSAVPPNMMLARDERTGPDDSADEDLAGYAARQGQVLAKGLPGFQLQREGELQVAGQPAHECLFVWQAGAHALTQWVVWLGQPDHSVITFTATCDAVQFDQHHPLFESALHNLKVDAARLPPRVAR